MNKQDVASLLTKHDEAIRRLETSSGQMMLLWKVVGAAVLVVLSVYLNSMIK